MPWKNRVAGCLSLAVALAAPAARADVPYRLVHTFGNSAGGFFPGPVVGRQTGSDPASWALYGMTATGGSTEGSLCAQLGGCGIVYKLAPPAPAAGPGGGWTLTRLYVFKGAGDGQNPTGPLAFDASGAAYGTTGPASATPPGTGSPYGTVFRLTPPAPGQYFWNKSVLHYFKYLEDGANPASGVFVDASGVYGTTQFGKPGGGVVFRMTPPASGNGLWTETVLHTFDPADGYPVAGLVRDPAGAFYGATAYGVPYGDATVFSLAPPAPGKTAWTHTVLARFPQAEWLPGPVATLVRDASGTLYGSIESGVSGGYGLIFSLAPPGPGQTAWKRTVLHTFNGYDGIGPGSLSLVGGALVGLTKAHFFAGAGGPRASGSVAFRLSPPEAGQTSWKHTVLYAFPLTVHGDNFGAPTGALTVDPGGTLFGTSEGYVNFGDPFVYGTAFKFLPTGP